MIRKNTEGMKYIPNNTIELVITDCGFVKRGFIFGEATGIFWLYYFFIIKKCYRFPSMNILFNNTPERHSEDGKYFK